MRQAGEEGRAKKRLNGKVEYGSRKQSRIVGRRVIFASAEGAVWVAWPRQLFLLLVLSLGA